MSKALTMHAIRKILLPLLVIPFGMLLYVFANPDWQWESPGLDSLFAVISIPIVVFNFLAWFYPEIIQAYFPVKEEWDRSDKPVTLAMALSAFIAFACVGVGAVSAISGVGARPTPRSYAAQSTAVIAGADSAELLPDPANAKEQDVVSILTQSAQTDVPTEPAVQTPQADILSETTPQIPVSGGAAISSPTSATIRTQAPPASTQATQPSSQATSLVTSQATSQPTSSGSPSSLCVAASQDFLDNISLAVQDADPDNDVDTKGWAVQSKAAEDLWFVGAKIQGPQVGTTLPGVWAVFVYSDGYLDTYAINDIAVNFSYAASGEDSDPVLSMQSDGAQAAYDCALRAR